MRLGLLMIGLVLAPIPILAQTICTPTPIARGGQWGPPGAGMTPVPTYWTVVAQGYDGDPTGYVPPGEVWLIRAAGGAVRGDGRQLEWMLQIDHYAPSGCCWLVPLHRLNGTAGGTPTIALDRPIVLEAGERLSLRVNGLPPQDQISLLWVGWSFPAACLPRLLGVEETSGAVVVGGGTVTPDFTALVAAAQIAATALSGLAQSVP